MLSFTAYLTEKVEALLRLATSEGIPAGYRPVSEFFVQPRADDQLCRRIQNYADGIKSGKLTPDYKRQSINPRLLIPTQYNVEGESIADIVHKGGGESAIKVARIAGRFYVADGHHRGAAAIYLQQPVSADVFTMDPH